LGEEEIAEVKRDSADADENCVDVQRKYWYEA
jgi:hypothetical protein